MVSRVMSAFSCLSLGRLTDLLGLVQRCGCRCRRQEEGPSQAEDLMGGGWLALLVVAFDGLLALILSDKG